MIGGNAVEPLERDVLDDDRLAFGNLDGDVDLVLVRVQLHIDADDLGVRITPIGVVGLDPLDVAVELFAVEKMPARPWKKPVLLAWR